ncbi:hypothetical protein ACFLYV_02625 [Chloroflexota bacterium]
MTTERVAVPMIGFLTMERTINDDGYITAIMITDNRGYPLEFKATSPVRPSLVQKTLYGNRLEHYIGVELCGKQLIQQSQRKPKLILIPNKSLLDVAEKVDVDVLAIWRAGEKIKLDEESDVLHKGTLKSTSFQSLIYEGHFKDETAHKEGVTFLQGMANQFDLLEAFERMRAALQLLAKEDSKYA